MPKISRDKALELLLRSIQDSGAESYFVSSNPNPNPVNAQGITIESVVSKAVDLIMINYDLDERCSLCDKMVAELSSELERLSSEIKCLTIEREFAETRIKLFEEMLNVIPECDQHGKSCIPHAIEWVLKAKEIVNGR